MSNQMRVIEALALRNAVRSNQKSKDWIIEQIDKMCAENFWNSTHIANFTGFSRSFVSNRKSSGRSKVAGRLDITTLDVILELTGDVEEPARSTLIRTVIATGTSTTLLSVLTGISLGTILYQQRTMKKEAD